MYKFEINESAIPGHGTPARMHDILFPWSFTREPNVLFSGCSHVWHRSTRGYASSIPFLLMDGAGHRHARGCLGQLQLMPHSLHARSVIRRILVVSTATCNGALTNSRRLLHVSVLDSSDREQPPLLRFHGYLIVNLGSVDSRHSVFDTPHRVIAFIVKVSTMLS